MGKLRNGLKYMVFPPFFYAKLPEAIRVNQTVGEFNMFPRFVNKLCSSFRWTNKDVTVQIASLKILTRYVDCSQFEKAYRREA